MPHTKSDSFKPPPDVNLVIADLHKPYNQRESSSVIGIKIQYAKITSGLSVKSLITPISPHKAHILNLPDIPFTSEILVGKEVIIKAQAPYPMNILVRVLHGEVRLCQSHLRNPEHEILISDEIALIYFFTEILIIESISKFAILTISAFLNL